MFYKYGHKPMLFNKIMISTLIANKYLSINSNSLPPSLGKCHVQYTLNMKGQTKKSP